MNNRNKITFKIVLLTVDAWSQRSCRASHSSHRAPAGRSRHTRGPGSLWPAWFRSHSWISLLFGTYPCMWTFVRVYFFFPGYEIALLSGNTDHKEYFFLSVFFLFFKRNNPTSFLSGVRFYLPSCAVVGTLRCCRGIRREAALEGL